MKHVEKQREMEHHCRLVQKWEMTQFPTLCFHLPGWQANLGEINGEVVDSPPASLQFYAAIWRKLSLFVAALPQKCPSSLICPRLTSSARWTLRLAFCLNLCSIHKEKLFTRKRRRRCDENECIANRTEMRTDLLHRFWMPWLMEHSTKIITKVKLHLASARSLSAQLCPQIAIFSWQPCMILCHCSCPIHRSNQLRFQRWKSFIKQENFLRRTL